MSGGSGFHTLGRRGITHRTIGVSHTESRGFTHQPSSQHPRNPRFFALFPRLNLLNNFYLTESLNLRQRGTNRDKEEASGIAPYRVNGPSLHAGYRRHKTA